MIHLVFGSRFGAGRCTTECGGVWKQLMPQGIEQPFPRSYVACSQTAPLLTQLGNPCARQEAGGCTAKSARYQHNCNNIATQDATDAPQNCCAANMHAYGQEVLYMLQWQGKPLAGSSFLGNLASAGMGGSAVHSGGSPPKYMLECLQRETACQMLCQACGRHQTQPPGQTP